tara:strand:- start:321 stop:557 length:237 start_codon:yes stop_codon:yes gene_type:complete
MGGFVARVIAKPKAQEQPRVASQMDAVKPTGTPAGPTKIEMADRRRLGISKRGRSATILTSITGASDDLTLGRKTLLG